MLPKNFRLHRESNFKKVYRDGRKVSHKKILLYFLNRGDENSSRAGFVVSKKLGKIAYRNRIKRLAREAFHQNIKNIPLGFDLVFIINTTFKNFREAQEVLIEILGKSDLFEGEKAR